MLSRVTETSMIARLTVLFVAFAFANGNPAAGKPWTWKSPKPLASPAGLAKSSSIGSRAEATPHSHPYYVALFIDDLYFCGGSLISTEWVLTAAHCMDGAGYVAVIMGAHNIQENEATQVTMTSFDFVIHENYNSLTTANDVAVIKLPTAVTLNEYIGTVDLPSTDVSEGTTVTVIGWASSGGSGVLMEENVTVISNADCNAIFGIIADGQICTAGSLGKDICYGDNGGPLLNDGKTYGIGSFQSSSGCEAGYPGVFARVHSYLDWIAVNTGVTP